MPYGFACRVSFTLYPVKHGWDPDTDIEKAAAHFRRRAEERRRALGERFAEAERQLQRAIDCAGGFPGVLRLITWGSVLRPECFSEISDIDLCVQGIADPREWGRLERALLDVVDMPLHLVRWEELIEPHRERILARGKVVYEKP